MAAECEMLPSEWCLRQLMLQKHSDLVLNIVGSTMAPDDCGLPEAVTAFGLILQVMAHGISYGNYSQRRHTAD